MALNSMKNTVMVILLEAIENINDNSNRISCFTSCWISTQGALLIAPLRTLVALEGDLGSYATMLKWMYVFNVTKKQPN